MIINFSNFCLQIVIKFLEIKKREKIYLNYNQKGKNAK